MSCLKESIHELSKPKDVMQNPQLEQVLRMNRARTRASVPASV